MKRKKTKRITLILCCLTCLGCKESETRSENKTTASVTHLENLSDEEKAQLSPKEQTEDILELVRLIDLAWAYKEEKSLDTEALKKEFLPRIDKELTPQAFFPILQELVARTKDGHASISLPNYKKYNYVIPVHIEEINGQFWIRRLLTDLYIGDFPLQIGDEILSIAGQNIAELIEERQKFIPASSENDLKVKTLREILSTNQINNSVSVKRDGKKLNLTVGGQPNIPTLWTDAFGDLDSKPLDKDLFYIKVPSFLIYINEGEEEFKRRSETFKEAFDQASHYSNLILDLRDNWGGHVIAAAEIAKYLLPTPFDYGHFRFRNSEALKNSSFGEAITDTKGWAPLRPWRVEKDESITPYSGQLFVLINGASFSSSDDLSAALKDLHPNVIFVGEPTGAGSGLAVNLGELTHSKAVFSISTSFEYSPHQRVIEGVGTDPDIPVQWTEKAIKTGTDPFIEAVQNKLK